MPRTVQQGFDLFLEWLTPLQSQREAAARHRASVEASIENAMQVYLFRETGSFRHGTGVRHYTDVDLLVSIARERPGSSDTALGWIKSALQSSFPSTTVRVSRPAVVIEFAGGDETWEIIPGFLTAKRATCTTSPAPAAAGWTQRPWNTSPTSTSATPYRASTAGPRSWLAS